MARPVELDVIVHHDSDAGGSWAEVVQLPGCFAAGHSLAELEESLQEAILLYLKDGNEAALFSSDRVEGVRRYRLSKDRQLIPVSA
jgi:predicted RNase H-like HicB family nuclease